MRTSLLLDKSRVRVSRVVKFRLQTIARNNSYAGRVDENHEVMGTVWPLFNLDPGHLARRGSANGPSQAPNERSSQVPLLANHQTRRLWSLVGRSTCQNSHNAGPVTVIGSVGRVPAK